MNRNPFWQPFRGEYSPLVGRSRHVLFIPFGRNSDTIIVSDIGALKARLPISPKYELDSLGENSVPPGFATHQHPKMNLSSTEISTLLAPALSLRSHAMAHLCLYLPSEYLSMYDCQFELS